MKLPSRSRILLFRVTPEEFLAIEAAQELSGDRSISEFCRNTVLSAARLFHKAEVEEMTLP